MLLVDFEALLAAREAAASRVCVPTDKLLIKVGGGLLSVAIRALLTTFAPLPWLSGRTGRPRRALEASDLAATFFVQAGRSLHDWARLLLDLA